MRLSARDGAGLAYREDGRADGPAVVLLHSLGADGHMWDGCAPELGRDHRLVVPDSRGHGDSGPARSSSVDQWVEDLSDVLDAAGVGPVLLAGVSLGGIQAIAFAAAHPQRVRGLVVADSFAALPTDAAQSKIRGLVDHSRQEPMTAVADQYLADTFQRPYPAGAAAVRRSIAAMDAVSYAASVTACFGVQIQDRLSQVEAPTLVLWGDRDAKTPRHLSQQIADGIAGAVLEVVPDAGHLSNIDNPAAFAAAVTTFSAVCGARPARLRAEGGM
ncbi:MAG: alpha/beta hydrolase [Modestobacter sp.]|jgi:3-oxoadipate enol-lactonase|nr:alpha/beta hydrolase [Modestobacter sp.]